MGLKEMERISAIAINPQNPDIVYIGVPGHAFGPNEERVFMTDGGKTWPRRSTSITSTALQISISIQLTETFFTPLEL